MRLESLLHFPADASDQGIQKLIKAGFSTSSGKAFHALGAITPLERDQILPIEGLKAMLARDQQLTVDETDRLFRIAHIIAMAQTVFGNDEKAKRLL